jgi:hypothetical protein
MSRSVLTLKLMYLNTQLLIYRPFLLGSFSSEATEDEKAGINECVKQCLEAAMEITEIVEGISFGDDFFNAYWVRSLRNR